MNAFQRSPVPMLDAMGLTGLPDLERRLDEHPELIEKAVHSITVIDVTMRTLRLFETDDKEAMLGPLPVTVEAAARSLAGRGLAAINSLPDLIYAKDL